ncbi:hypothetical protein WDJ51_09900 [Rathayibacter sp. YIM 133350]|uniref:hypothetical protein n=1 Tax=Rathayibacter sp. YIM 133350 TaxID=3131992 RepID=UPI00307FBE47
MRRFFILLLVTTVGFVAYTYGAKAGRGRYRDIRASLDALWNDPRVKKARKKANQDAAKIAKSAEKRALRAVSGGH